MLPQIPIKAILTALGFVGVCLAAFLLYTHITLQASTIEALQASVELQKHNAELAQSAANDNAKMYEQLSERNTATLQTLHELQKNIDVIKEADNKQENKTNEYIDKLDKESFEAKCYNMLVADNG